MNTELEEEKRKLVEDKKKLAIKFKSMQFGLNNFLKRFAAADMALKEFDRKHGVISEH